MALMHRRNFKMG